MTISPAAVRYIKLGRSGGWADVSLDRGEVHFGYRNATHELALEGDHEKIKQHLIGLGRNAKAASRDATEVLDFYQLGSDCLWITLEREHLWWTFAAPEVTWAGGDGSEGERVRKCIDRWRNDDINGQPLRINALSTKLTKVGSYRRTICRVDAEEYLLRRINGVQEAIVERSAAARALFMTAIEESLQSLHWADFETLVDIIFARSGWHRVSALGGTQALIDFELQQPATNETAAVQVKSSASQKTLDEYISKVDEAERFDRFFFVCHTPRGSLSPPPDRGDIHVWTGQELASIVLRLGLQDWVLEKVA